jgi:hypothetical protein
VKIQPDLSDFDEEMKAKLEEITAGKSEDVPIKPEMDDEDVAKVLAEKQELGKPVDTLVRVKEEAIGTGSTMNNWPMVGELDPKAKQTLGELEQALQQIDGEAGHVGDKFQKWGLGIALADGPLAHANDELTQLDETANKTTEVVDNVKQKIQEGVGEFAYITDTAARNSIESWVADQQEVRKTSDEVTSALERFSEGAITYDQALHDMVVAGKEPKDAAKALEDELGNLKKSLTDTGEAADEGKGKLEGWAKSWSDIKSGLEGAGQSLIDGWNNVTRLNGALMDMAAPIDALEGGMRGVEGVLNDFQSGASDAETALQDLETLGLDAAQSFTLLGAAGMDVTTLLSDLGLGAEDVELVTAALVGMGVDAEMATQAAVVGLTDMEEGIQTVESVVNQAVNGGGGIGAALTEIGSGFGEAAAQMGPMVGLIGLIVAAVVAAIPVVAVLSGGLLALASVATIGAGGAVAALLGVSGGLQELKTVATEALNAYRQALKPFTQPLVDEMTPIIIKGLMSIVPIAQQGALALQTVLREVNTDLSSSGFAKFIEWAKTEVQPSIQALASFFGNVVSMIASMGEASQPFTDMVRRGLVSLGEEMARFGQSNTFKDFIVWLQQNGPTVWHDIESIGVSIGRIITDLAPLGMTMLALFTHLSAAIADVTKPIAETLGVISKGVDSVMPFVHAFTGMESAVDNAIGPFANILDPIKSMQTALDPIPALAQGVGGAMSFLGSIFGGGAPPVQDYTKGIHDLAETFPELQSKGELIRSDIEKLNEAYRNGSIDQKDYKEQLSTLTGAMTTNQGAMDTYNANLFQLQQNFGLSRQGVIDLSDKLNLNLTQALNPSAVAAFGTSISGMGVSATEVQGQLAGLAAEANNATQSMITAGNNAANAAKQSWSTYGSAVQAFATATLPVSAAAITLFYGEQQTMAASFASNIQKAIQDGYSPSLISQIAQAGPAQAGQLLQGLVSNYSGSLVGMVNSSVSAISKEGAIAVEMARETAMAVKAPTEAIAAALPIAQQLYLKQTQENSAQAVLDVMTQYNIGLPQVVSIAQEYGNALPQGIQAQIIEAQLLASRQGITVQQALTEVLAGTKAAADQVAGATPTAINEAQPQTISAAQAQAKIYQDTWDAQGQPISSTLAAVMSGAAVNATGQINWDAVGNAVDSGISSGIAAHGQQAVDAVTAVMNNVKGASLRAVLASSPSRWFADHVGAMISLGIAAGVTEQGQAVSDAVTGVLGAAMETAGTWLPVKISNNPGGVGGPPVDTGGGGSQNPTSGGGGPIVPPRQGPIGTGPGGTITPGTGGVAPIIAPYGQGSGQYQVLYNPSYTIHGDADPSTVAKWQALMDEHDNKLIADLYAEGG